MRVTKNVSEMGRMSKNVNKSENVTDLKCGRVSKNMNKRESTSD